MEFELIIAVALVLIASSGTWYLTEEYYNAKFKAREQAEALLAERAATQETALQTSRAAAAGVRVAALEAVLDNREGEYAALAKKYDGVSLDLHSAEQLYNDLLAYGRKEASAGPSPVPSAEGPNLACASSEDSARAAATAAAINGNELLYCKQILHEVVELWNGDSK